MHGHYEQIFKFFLDDGSDHLPVVVNDPSIGDTNDSSCLQSGSEITVTIKLMSVCTCWLYLTN